MNKTLAIAIGLIIIGAIIALTSYTYGKRNPDVKMVDKLVKEQTEKIIKDNDAQVAERDTRISALQKTVSELDRKNRAKAQTIAQLKAEREQVKAPQTSDEARKRFEALGYKPL